MDFQKLIKPLVLIAAFSTGAFAYPLDPTPYGVDNQGDSLTLQNIGDERYRRIQTVDGYLVIRDSLGVYYFADENGEASQVKARNAENRGEKEKKFLRNLDRKRSFENHRKRHPDRVKWPADKGSGPAPWVNPSRDASAVPPVLRLPAPEGHAVGTNRFVVILVSNSQTTDIDSAQVVSILNTPGYSSDGYVGSVRDYFYDQSMGKFVPSFDVFRVQVNNAFSSYKNNEYSLVVEAISALRSKYPSFDASLYDSDGDREVDALAVMYAGSEADANDMGGFQHKLQYNRGGMVSAGNGIQFNTYFVINQEGFFPVFIHEFSHTMGLKDHYCVSDEECYNDYTNSQYQAPGAHGWDVMSTGMYNGGHKNPPSYSAFERNFMGWLDYESLDDTGSVTVMEPLASSNKAFKIPVPGTNDEWFVIENRQWNNRWDAKLPNHGLLIWHIDYDEKVWNSDAMNDDKATRELMW